ncbi:related to RTM1 protein [Serendipita indica DSM 11827]|uniref:Related to RTM1 protein n=1 Tax=Serendipita indica (strain DSM 11827) TaxID=1109443 RepID=G4TPV6_SERID|nr:related to RTM1 protein [Serendipita indica DSM 11827]
MERSYFPYKASKPAAVLFAVLYSVSVAAHVFQMIKLRAYFMSVLIVGLLVEVLGYVTRKLAIDDDPTLWSFSTSQVCILVAPAFLAASAYMIVGRMMAYVGPGASVISHRLITKVFVIVDILCLITQAAGIAMFVTNVDKADRTVVLRGRNILMTGLALQIISYLIFVVITIIFDIRAQRMKGTQLKKLRPLFWASYSVAFLIIGRSIYRAIEFGTVDFKRRTQGYLYTHEWPFYVLDAVPILAAAVILNVIHPSSYLPSKKGLRMDGTIEVPARHWWSKSKSTKEHELENATP